MDEYFRQPIVVSGSPGRLYPTCFSGLDRSLAPTPGGRRAARLCEAVTEKKKELLGTLFSSLPALISQSVKKVLRA